MMPRLRRSAAAQISPYETACEGRKLITLPTALLLPNPGQPRAVFHPADLQELADSIAQYGVLQPLTVRLTGDPPRYQLIAGERRLRAARMAGLDRVPCVLMKADDMESSLLALVENLQRRDLDCFEAAAGYRRLIEQYGLTQGEAARRMGISQSAVANKLRLLRFDDDHIAIIRRARLTERHARCVLRLPPPLYREALLQAEESRLTVAQTEAWVSERLRTLALPAPVPEVIPDKPPPQLRRHPKLLFRDARILLNTVDRAVKAMQDAGVNAVCEKREDGEALVLTVRIPHKKSICDLTQEGDAKELTKPLPSCKITVSSR